MNPAFWCGLPVYLSQPVVRRHDARRRGRRGRVRSCRTWVDRVCSAALGPDEVVVMKGRCIVAGVNAYKALLRKAQTEKQAHLEFACGSVLQGELRYP